MLFAQGGDIATMGAGWAGAGLLGLVLGWLLLKHLPAKDQQIKDILDIHASTIAAMTEKHDHAVIVLAEKHERQMDLHRQACQEDSKKLVETLREQAILDRNFYKGIADADRGLMEQKWTFHQNTVEHSVRMLQYLYHHAGGTIHADPPGGR